MTITFEDTTAALELAVDVTKTKQFTQTHVKTLDDLRQ